MTVKTVELFWLCLIKGKNKVCIHQPIVGVTSPCKCFVGQKLKSLGIAALETDISYIKLNHFQEFVCWLFLVLI